MGSQLTLDSPTIPEKKDDSDDSLSSLLHLGSQMTCWRKGFTYLSDWSSVFKTILGQSWASQFNSLRESNSIGRSFLHLLVELN